MSPGGTIGHAEEGGVKEVCWTTMWEKRYCRNEIKIPEIRPFCVRQSSAISGEYSGSEKEKDWLSTSRKRWEHHLDVNLNTCTMAPEMTPTTSSQPSLCTTTIRLRRESVPIRTIWQRSLYGAGDTARGKVGNTLILWSTEASAGPHGPSTSGNFAPRTCRWTRRSETFDVLQQHCYVIIWSKINK